MRSHSTDGLLTWSVRYLSSVGIGRSTFILHRVCVLFVFFHLDLHLPVPPTSCRTLSPPPRSTTTQRSLRVERSTLPDGLLLRTEGGPAIIARDPPCT
jgi:hypothetical protein